MASGVRNMTRGLGTALGLSLTGLVFTLAGGDTDLAQRVGHAFSTSAVFLALVALAAGTLAGLRGASGPGAVKAVAG